MIGDPLSISREQFDVYVRARILSTRGYGEPLSDADVNSVKTSAYAVVKWMDKLADAYLSQEPRYE